LAYHVRFTSRAERQFAKLPATTQRQLQPLIEDLAEQPRPGPPLGRKLQGMTATYRLRKGDWRVVYEILDDEVVVLIVFVGNRRDAYRAD